MSVESDIHDVLAAVPGGASVFPDVAPLNTAAPWFVYQQVGGDVVTFVERAVPNKRNARFQISVWSKTRALTASLSRQAETAIATANTLVATPLSAAVALYEPDTKLYGAQQDFSVWY